MKNSRVLRNAALTFVAVVGLTTIALGQSGAPIPLQIGDADQVTTTDASFHTAAVAGPTGTTGSSVVSSNLKPGPAGVNQGGQPRGFFPVDLGRGPSGKVIDRAQIHLIYVNQPPSHWGDVAQFLTDLGQSDYIHIVDQYVGAHDDNRYTVGPAFQATVPLPAGTSLRLGQILALVHAAASITGSGYGHIYELLLPQGMDTCAPWGCYQPDLGNSSFCAYHESVTYQDAVGHAIFTVQPYAGIHGCEQPPSGTTHGQAADSQNAFVAHETIEAITDPDGYSWFVQTLDSDFGYEVADLCQQSQLWPDGYYYGSAQNIQLNGKWYTVPGMYSNRNHGCAFFAPH